MFQPWCEEMSSVMVPTDVAAPRLPHSLSQPVWRWVLGAFYGLIKSVQRNSQLPAVEQPRHSSWRRFLRRLWTDFKCFKCLILFCIHEERILQFDSSPGSCLSASFLSLFRQETFLSMTESELGEQGLSLWLGFARWHLLYNSYRVHGIKGWKRAGVPLWKPVFTVRNSILNFN